MERKHVSKLVPSNSIVFTCVVVAVAVVNSATLGYDTSCMNGLQILPSYTEYFHLTPATLGLNNAASWMGSILCTPFMQWVPDKFGRKNAILVSAITCFIGATLQAASQNIGMFISARIIIGLGSALSSGAAPALLGELLPAVTRGRILGFFFSCFYVGSLTAAIVTYGSRNITSTWAWRLPSLLQFLPSLLSLCIWPFIPESPRWLISKGRHEHALEVLVVAQGHGDANSEVARVAFAEIEGALHSDTELSKHNPWREIVSTPSNRRRLLILCTFGVMINSFGNFIVSYYLNKILDQAGVTDTKTQTQINVIISCWSFAVALIGSYCLDLIGRRKQALIGVGGMIAMLYLIGGLIKTYGERTNKSGIYGTIAVIFLFQGFYAFSITPLTTVYPTEVSNFKIRTTGIAIFRMLDSGFGLLSSFALSFAMADLGWKFYFINASWVVVFWGVIWFTWVETNGLTLEGIAVLFDGPAAEDVEAREAAELEVRMQSQRSSGDGGGDGGNSENDAHGVKGMKMKKSDGVVVSVS